jgi:hypothetical protein
MGAINLQSMAQFPFEFAIPKIGRKKKADSLRAFFIFRSLQSIAKKV